MNIPFLTIGENKLTLSPGSIISKSGAIKWTNRRECPPNHTFNSEGWVETLTPYPKISVVSPLFLSEKYFTKTEILLQNLLALRMLNNKPHELLLQLLLKKLAKNGYYYSESEIDSTRTLSLQINSIVDLPSMDRSIFRWDTLWASDLGRAQINRRRVHNTISDIREEMSISKKYKTLHVKHEAKTTLYAVKTYWAEMGWDSSDRSRRALLEALNEYEDASPRELASIAGLALSTVYKYLPKTTNE